MHNILLAIHSELKKILNITLKKTFSASAQQRRKFNVNLINTRFR